MKVLTPNLDKAYKKYCEVYPPQGDEVIDPESKEIILGAFKDGQDYGTITTFGVLGVTCFIMAGWRYVKLRFTQK